MEKLSAVLKLLQSGEELPARYKDHPLRHNWKGYRDLHIEPDWVLIYKVMGDEVVLLAATGTHAHIF